MTGVATDFLSAQESDIRLQVTWGGGTARQWQGTVAVSGGGFSELVHLGLEADQAAAIFVGDKRVQIRSASSRDFDGFEVLITADLSAQLSLELAPVGQPQELRKIELPLTQLISDYHYSKLDEQGNQILIHRAGSDTLRVDFDRDSLVFSPGERFDFRVFPHLLGPNDSEPLRCVVELVEAHSRRQIWIEEVNLDLQLGSEFAPAGPFTITTPDAEGVYDILISVHRKRFRDTFVPSKPVHRRKIQFVVISSEAPPSENQPWELVDAVDPTDTGWMDWINQVPKLPLLPDFRHESLGNQKMESREYLGRKLAQLGNGGWQAYPLPIDEIGKPHLLVVEYPSDLPQTLGISIIETNAVGKVVPIGLDSGVDVPRGLANLTPHLLRHKLVFWPRTNTPYVLLTNRREQGSAIFGTIRVFAGPTALPPATLPKISPPKPALPGAAAVLDQPIDSQTSQSTRLLATYFEKPLFPENFSATEAADEGNGRSLDDWTTFLEGGGRLVEYLKYTGYNGAVISVACQGSTIYPSQLLTPNPKYDTGVYFSTGQDPVRKDVLEMLFRLFDRAGLRLIPAVQFSGPLRQLEELRRRQPDQTTGIDLVDSKGQRWPQLHGTHQGMAPYYNPLDPRVQSAMRRVLIEITDRYSKHPSFGGLSLEIGVNTFATLPGGDWGQDTFTRKRFEQKKGDKNKAFRPRDRQQAWLAWRSKELAKFHRTILGDITKQRQDATLFLLGGNLFTDGQVQKFLRPTLPNRMNLADAMLQLGLDAKHYDKQQQIVLLRPDRIASRAELASQAININLATNPSADRHFERIAPSGSLFVHEPQTLPLPEFDQASPFGPGNTHTLLVTHATPSASENRRRFVHRLALRDEQYLIDGGWMLPMGQEEAVMPLFRTLAQLPAETFETVQPNASGLPTQPIIVRRLKKNDQTFIYVVNDSPWSVSAEVDLQAPHPFQLAAIGSDNPAEPRSMGPEQTWELELKPYAVVAAVVSSPQLEIPTWRSTIDRTAFTRLRQQVNSIRARASLLNRPTKIDALLNPGFEMAADNAPGWLQHAHGDGITIKTDQTEHFSGKQSLKLASTGPVAWVRSDPIEPPRTGRISVIVRLKTADPAKQPPLCVAIEWRQNGKVVYQHANVGKWPNAKPLTNDWGKQPFLAQFSDLPTSGLTDLKIGFDLMGAGEVWIDDVEVYHLWFLPNERDELMIMSALADRSLSKGNISDCQRILSGYWPQFLRDYVAVQQPRAATLPKEAPRGPHQFPPPRKTEASQPEPEQETSVFDKMKRLPAKVFPFRIEH